MSDATPPSPNSSSPSTAPQFTWTADDIRRFGHQVVDVIAEHLTNLPERPVFQPVPRELIDRFLRESVPESGMAPEAVLAEFAERIEPYPFGNGHPRFFGWINSPPDVIAIFAEALAAAMNPSVAGGNHAAVYVEREVIGWFRDLLGFPAESMGLLVSGSSMANLTGLAVARHVAGQKMGVDMRALGLQRDGPRFVVYVSQEGHSSLRKAVELLGIGSENLRSIEVDASDRIRLPELETSVRRDRADGYVPMAVAASAGTTNTGAIDPLVELADLCAEHGIWLHVDGAYGAAAILTERFHDLLVPLGRADSVALDPHKWLYVPVEAGLVLVRSAEAMRDTFSLVPPYLRTDARLDGVGGPPWLSEFGFQQTRGFRALKVWMALKHHGLDGYRALLEHDLGLADHLVAQIQAMPDLELLAHGLSVVCFRLAPPELRPDAEQLDELNRRVLAAVQLSGQAFVTGTTVKGNFALRACVVNPRSTSEDVDALLTLVRQPLAAMPVR
ncbi:MAG: aminotransferase class V-fold PLP-dependent enzyme [Chloroflexi bacterium]|nr:aminotransferase class V-fold PLP-dependent enzyme [Chloroflexota bacterium]